MNVGRRAAIVWLVYHETGLFRRRGSICFPDIEYSHAFTASAENSWRVYLVDFSLPREEEKKNKQTNKAR